MRTLGVEKDLLQDLHMLDYQIKVLTTQVFMIMHQKVTRNSAFT